MKIDQSLDRFIGESVEKKYEEDRVKHTPSGKISASILGNPLQWQILKVIGVPSDIDEYVKRKFQRGKDVEDWVVKNMRGLVDSQKEVNYRNCVGYVDAVIDSKDYGLKLGVIPHEIKSVANAKYRRIVGTMTRRGQGADRSHCLQSTLYALAMGASASVLDYIASDDYRATSFVIGVEEYKDTVERIIDRFYKQIASGKMPRFSAEEEWQYNIDYNSYPQWAELNSKQCMSKLEKEFPESYKKLKSYEVKNEVHD